MIEFKGRKVDGIDIDGIDPSDYPDFCDAFICAAHWVDTGEDLSDEELEDLQECNQDMVYEMAYERACCG